MLYAVLTSTLLSPSHPPWCERCNTTWNYGR